MPWFRWLKKEATAAEIAATEGAPPAEPEPARGTAPGESTATAEARKGRPQRAKRSVASAAAVAAAGAIARRSRPRPASRQATRVRRRPTSRVPRAAHRGRDRRQEAGQDREAGQARPWRAAIPLERPAPQAAAAPGAAAGGGARAPDLRRRRRAARRRARGREGCRGVPRAARSAARSPGTSTSASSTTCCPAWRRRSSRSGWRRTASSTWTRSSCPELEGKRQGKKITDLIQRGQQILVQAVKDPMKTKGARLTTEISLPGRFLVYVPHGEGLGVSRRLDDTERQRLKEILKELDPKQGGIIVRTAAEGASAEDVERDLVFLQRLWKTIQARAESGHHAGARVPGGGAPAAHRARPVRRRLPRRARRRRPRVQAHRRLPEEDLAAHARASAPRQGEGAPVRPLRCGEGDRLDARAARRPSLRRLPDLRLRRGVHGDRRQHGPLRRLTLEEHDAAARGHDREEQPRGGEGGRAAAAAARHRRDHRHRLHRHGEPEEPPGGRGGAADRARARPHEDVRGRDLAARPRRDDAPERDRRPSRGHDATLPDLRRRRHRRLGRDRGARGGAPAARPCRSRGGHPRAGLPGRGASACAAAARRPRRRTARGARGAHEAPVLPRARRGPRPYRPPRGRSRRASSPTCSPSRRSRRARSSR